MSKWVSEVVPDLINIKAVATTGEILSEQPIYKRKKINYNFIMVFDIRELAKRLSGKNLEAFTIIVDKANFGNTIDISSGLRKMMKVELNTSLQNISKYIKEMKDKDMIRSTEYDEWMINPELVWKGSVSDREEALIRWKGLI